NHIKILWAILTCRNNKIFHTNCKITNAISIGATEKSYVQKLTLLTPDFTEKHNKKNYFFKPAALKSI
ncbi:hypothetical protein OZK63_43090, partial [Streptomyces sp. UMAF16]|nr:hypothetical protein [Streptomyces sp. UMAF16]